MVRGNDTNRKSQHKESARTEIARKICGFRRDIWGKEPPAPVVVRWPEREESPIRGVQGWQEWPESVNLGDISRDDGEDICSDCRCSAQLERIIQQRQMLQICGKHSGRHKGRHGG